MSYLGGVVGHLDILSGARLPESELALFDKAGRALTQGDYRKQVEEHVKRSFKAKQVELPVKHHFADGCYMREMYIPAGTILVGKIHKHACHNILVKGKLTVMDEKNGPMTIQAPYTYVSEAMVQKTAYAHEDCVWLTVHPTTETDPDKMVDLLTVPSYDAFEEQT